jgi:LmbE family N-acetylglucosaminyl deacetylase
MVRRSFARHPIDAPGTDERTWAAWPWLSTLAGPGLADAGLAGLARVRSAVIVAAHPDDEVLGLPDGGVAEREHELTTALAPLVAGFDLCLAPWDRDLHPDHEAAGRAARDAGPGRFHAFPVWMWHWARPGDARVPWDRALRVPLAPRTAGRKRAAIACFASQLEDRGHGLGPVLSPGVLAHFTRNVEVLLP